MRFSTGDSCNVNTARLGTLDAALVVIYLLAVMVLGLWMSRGVKSSKDFFLAGKSLPWWAVAMSLVVSDIGAKDMIGVAADSYRYGVVMMNFDFVGCGLAVLVAAFLFMPFFWMAGIYTIPEYLGRRYNQHVRRFFAVLWTLFMLATLGTIFVSAAAMFKVLLGWPFWFSVSVTALIVSVYTTVGGLKAVVVTDAFSCVILMVGAALICWFGLAQVGGWSGMREAIQQMNVSWTAHHFELLPPADHPKYSWPSVFLGLALVLGPAYWIGNQAIVQRNFGVRSENEARAAYVLCAAIKMFFPLLLVIPGLIALALFHDQLGMPFVDGNLASPDENWQGNLVLPLLVVKLLPTGILGVVVGAFLAGILPVLHFSIGPLTATQAMAMLGAAVVMTLVYSFSRKPEGIATHTLLLCGITISILSGGLIMLITYFVSPYEFLSIHRWMIGGVDVIGCLELVSLVILLIPGLVILLSCARAYNHMALGEDMAMGHGVDVQRTQLLTFVGAGITTAAAVAMTGPIGFVGMIIPHVVRNLSGADHRLVLPASFLLGGVVLGTCDAVARTVLAPTELPVGIITAVLGAPLFLFILLRRKG